MSRSPYRILSAAALLVLAGAANAQLQVNVDTTNRRQTIEGFGAAATGWWFSEVQNLYQQQSFADMIRDDLGITMVRVAVPVVQPNEDPLPLFLDWTRFNFAPFDLTANFCARLNQGHPGAVKVLGSLWTPPAWMKTNGSEIGGRLRLDRYPHFAKYCAGVCLGFENRYGVPMYALSLQNEPVFEEPYESCQYTETEYSNAVHAIAVAFQTWHPTSLIFGSEDVGTVPPRWYGFVTAMNLDPIAMNRMDRLAVHHYPWENNRDWTSPTAWTALATQCQPHGKPLWVSEVSGEEPTWHGNPNNNKGALTLSTQIHDALVFGEVTAYVYWGITSPIADRFNLMRLAEPTKKYQACKQFFRYIRPGAVRVVTTGGDADTMVSAFVHDQQGTMTVVAINIGPNTTPVRFNISGPSSVGSFTMIRSSETEDFVNLGSAPVVAGHVEVSLPPWSVTTLYGTSCYANCDQSTASPVLNVADFVCFQGKFAAGDLYANCDGSTTPPVLNVGDFVCFQQRFAAGCP